MAQPFHGVLRYPSPTQETVFEMVANAPNSTPLARDRLKIIIGVDYGTTFTGNVTQSENMLKALSHIKQT